METPTQASGSTEGEALPQLAKRYAAKLASGKGDAVLADELASSSGCSTRDARVFMAALAPTGLRQELSPATLVWAAAFARRASAEIGKDTVVSASRFLLVGVVGVGVLIIWNPQGLAPDVREILQWIVLGLGGLVIIGFLGIVGGAFTWLQNRGTAWPAPLVEKPDTREDRVQTTPPDDLRA